MESFTIRSLQPNDEDAFNEFRRDVLNFDQQNPYSQNIVRELTPVTDFTTRLAVLTADQNPEKPELVPQFAFFMFNSENVILGRVRCRTEMTPMLARTGGHFGYHVAPSQRGHGYAKNLLKFALGYYQQRREPYVIVTAKAANWASRKTIEASGGVLQEILPEQNTESLAIYHIQLAAATGI